MTEFPDVLYAYFDGLKTHDVDRIAGTVADDLAVVLPVQTLGKQQFLTMLRALYAACPDWHYEHDGPERRQHVIAVKFRQGGTHTGTLALPGHVPVAATGRAIHIPEHFFFYQVRGDQIVEIRPEPVRGGAPGGIFEQLGVEVTSV